MDSSFKKVFFTSLMAVLLIVSNAVGCKYTYFMGLTLSVSFITYPFVFLCTLYLAEECGRKSAREAVLSSALIEIFILIGYILITNIGNQTMIPDLGVEVNQVFGVDGHRVMTSLIAFMVSNYVLVYIYDYFQQTAYRLLGTVLSIISALLLDGLIAIILINYVYGASLVLNMLLCHIIMSVFMTVIIVILFYVLKSKINIYEEKRVFVQDINVKIKDRKKLIDKNIDEVITTNPKKVVKKKTTKLPKNATRNRKNSKKAKKTSKENVK